MFRSSTSSPEVFLSLVFLAFQLERGVLLETCFGNVRWKPWFCACPIILALVFLGSLTGISHVFAEPGVSSVSSDSLTTNEAVDLVDAVLSVAGRLNSEQEEQKKLRKKMTSGKVSSDELKEIEESLNSKRIEIKNLEEDIDNIFSGIDINQLVERKDVDFDWARDVKEMIFPLFSELRSLTDRPREIERLKRKVDFLKTRRLKAIDKAILTISSLKQKLPQVHDYGQDLKLKKLAEREALNKEIAALRDNLSKKNDFLTSAKAALKETGKKAEQVAGQDKAPKAAENVLTPPVVSSSSGTAEAQSGKDTPDSRMPTTDISSLEEEIVAIKETIEEKELALVAVDGQLRKINQRLSESSSLNQILSLEEEQWKQLRSQASDELTVSEHRLEELKSAKSPVFDSVRNVISVFFQSRGRNILVGIFLALAFALAFRKFHAWLLKTSLYSGRKVPFALRLLDLFLHGVSFVGVIVIFQLVLYFFDDWLLLGVTLLFILTLLWLGARELPSMWQQLQLLLNFGVVRDGERIVLDGVPWKVEKVNIFTKLSNPWLSGGKIRVPLHELMNYRSRPASSDEAWFPSKEGNWVLLSDGTFGKVLLQTPETVKIVKYGGTTRVYSVSDYLGQVPSNLSCGFSVAITFGVDYAHQEIVCDEIPEKLCAYLKETLCTAGYEESLNDLKVQFKEAGSSSLDLIILSTFDGSVASDYFALQRLFQRGAVLCCTENGWGIPFPQITVHQAD